jgi:hypothetical protein
MLFQSRFDDSCKQIDTGRNYSSNFPHSNLPADSAPAYNESFNEDRERQLQNRNYDRGGRFTKTSAQGYDEAYSSNSASHFQEESGNEYFPVPSSSASFTTSNKWSQSKLNREIQTLNRPTRWARSDNGTRSSSYAGVDARQLNETATTAALRSQNFTSFISPFKRKNTFSWKDKVGPGNFKTFPTFGKKDFQKTASVTHKPVNNKNKFEQNRASASSIKKEIEESEEGEVQEFSDQIECKETATGQQKNAELTKVTDETFVSTDDCINVETEIHHIRGRFVSVLFS